jgi:hypothetical protein
MAQINENPLLKQALNYYRLGWAIIPVPYKSKKATIRWKQYQLVRPDVEQLEKWFSRGNANIAVICGEVSSGLACRDFDNMDEYNRWVKKYPDLAKILPTVKTSKGMHVYFEGYIKGIKQVAKGELRGSGGYCLLPPSIHPDGTNYEWYNPLFNGNLLVIDSELAGFTADGTEHTEKIEHTEQSEAIEGVDIVKKMILETLPKNYGTRNRQVFEFERALKSLPQFSDPDIDPKSLRDIAKQWHKWALPNIRTKEFEETWIDFLKGWDRVKYPKGKEPMATIFEQAIKLKPPETIARLYPDNKKLLTLASVCRELQRAADKEPFFLSVRTAAGYLGISPVQAGRYLFLLCAERVLVVVEKGGTAQSPRRASRYKFIAN